MPLAAPPDALRWAVVVFPGTNCELETQHVLGHVLGQQADLVWHEQLELRQYDALVLPGGFAHGDYLRAGAVARFSPVMRAVQSFAAAGKPVLGICNGFQVLLEAGLLPGAMLRNRRQRFVSSWVHVRVETDDSLFTSACRRGEVLRLPIAHGEGCYHADPESLSEMNAGGRILFRYCDAAGQVTPAANPNGSAENIAGIRNAAGNVAALMPHPERAAEAVLGSQDGRRIFESVIKSLAARSRTDS